MGERERERETQNPKQAPGSELSAQSPTQGSNSLTMAHEVETFESLRKVKSIGVGLTCMHKIKGKAGAPGGLRS